MKTIRWPSYVEPDTVIEPVVAPKPAGRVPDPPAVVAEPVAEPAVVLDHQAYFM